MMIDTGLIILKVYRVDYSWKGSMKNSFTTFGIFIYMITNIPPTFTIYNHIYC